MKETKQSDDYMFIIVVFFSLVGLSVTIWWGLSKSIDFFVANFPDDTNTIDIIRSKVETTEWRLEYLEHEVFMLSCIQNGGRYEPVSLTGTDNICFKSK